MEWIDIEKKWNDMAQRLQARGSMSAWQGPGCGPDESPREPAVRPRAEAVHSPETAARSMR